MRKLLLTLLILLISNINCFAAKIPDEVTNFINDKIPGADIRFDGVIILPDNTVYLPLYPSLFSDIKSLEIKETYPANTDFEQKPDIVIFNNDFVLLKVLTDSEGRKTVLKLQNPPLQVRTGLLPQDMLVPSGLILPENIKGIIGNLKIDTQKEDVIKINTKESYEEFLTDNDKVNNPAIIPQLKNKMLFVITNYSKNIQVLDPNDTTPKYSLMQSSIPINIKAVDDGKFLLVTSYERPFLDIISIADSRFIKQINLGSFPEEIILDEENNKAYITSPKASIIYVIDLNTMSLVQKIRVNGYCEKLLLTKDIIFYVDKLKGDIWAIETKNEYKLKNIGKFPNVSSLAFINNQLYLASRTKSRIAIVDYSTLGLIAEFTTVNKPIAMELYNNNLYILGAQNNQIQRINIFDEKDSEIIDLELTGFSSKFNRIEDSNLAIIIDIKENKYVVFDFEKNKVLKTYSMSIPVKDIIIADKVKLFD